MMYFNEEDRDLVHEYIVLPYVKKVLERDLQTVSNDKLFKIGSPYINLIEYSLSEISNRLREIKKQMYKRGIKVYEKERHGIIIPFIYTCRGYEIEGRYTTHAIKMHVNNTINELFNTSKDKETYLK